MQVRIVGGTVLNQDVDNPMSGSIIGRSENHFDVRWADGTKCSEYKTDVTLTGDIEFEVYDERT